MERMRQRCPLLFHDLMGDAADAADADFGAAAAPPAGIKQLRDSGTCSSSAAATQRSAVRRVDDSDAAAVPLAATKQHVDTECVVCALLPVVTSQHADSGAPAEPRAAAIQHDDSDTAAVSPAANVRLDGSAKAAAPPAHTAHSGDSPTAAHAHALAANDVAMAALATETSPATERSGNAPRIASQVRHMQGCSLLQDLPAGDESTDTTQCIGADSRTEPCSGRKRTYSVSRPAGAQALARTNMPAGSPSAQLLHMVDARVHRAWLSDARAQESRNVCRHLCCTVQARLSIVHSVQLAHHCSCVQHSRANEEGQTSR